MQDSGLRGYETADIDLLRFAEFLGQLYLAFLVLPALVFVRLCREDALIALNHFVSIVHEIEHRFLQIRNLLFLLFNRAKLWSSSPDLEL